MTPAPFLAEDELDPRFIVFHELMPYKVRDILLVSSLYDACIMEEDCRLAEQIIHEYRGLNLSKPPRLTWVSSAEEALAALEKQSFSLVLTMPRLADMDAYALGQTLKKLHPDLPVILLTQSGLAPDCIAGVDCPPGIDRIFVWTGHSELLLAIIKSVEDEINAAHDTKAAGVRVLLFIEDSPLYLSAVLPILYREVVGQTQAVMQAGLNEEHRLLTMRARAKILVAQTFEMAVTLFEAYRSNIMGVVSDVRFPWKGKVHPDSGLELLARFRREIHDLPMLLASSEPANRDKAQEIGALFIDKNSPSLVADIHSFFINYLGFGDFIFRMPDGSEVARVPNVRALERTLKDIPKESLLYHGNRNDFSRWLFARSEILLGQQVRPLTFEDFDGDVESVRAFLVDSLAARRKLKQKGVVVDFDATEFDPDTDFLKIGKGSLGGKARGLAFLSTLLHRNPGLHAKYPGVDIIVPRTLVLTTETFDEFIEAGGLKELSKLDLTDEEIAERCLAADFPRAAAKELVRYIEETQHPLAVRSSGMLEDAQFRAYAGLYRTYMIPNDHPDPALRFEELIKAIKLVYASTFFQGPKAFAHRVGQSTEEEKMAVIIQELVGHQHHEFFYPGISGVAQSHNYYPFARMKPEEGIATIALGLGKTVVEGGKSLRFSPRHPQIMPQFHNPEDWLENAQQSFYALVMGRPELPLGVDDEATLVQRDIYDALNEPPVAMAVGTYIPEEDRIRDTAHGEGPKVVNFSQVLKYKRFPLPDLLSDVLDLGREGMGTPVEIEFSVRLYAEKESKPAFALLQIRPMTARADQVEVEINKRDEQRAFCISHSALGNVSRRDIEHIVYVRPETFDPGRTVEIARDIGRLNAVIRQRDDEYILIGPGRWGSADPWLGIPVSWADISSICAVVETVSPKLKAQPSQGSHFFHNVTTLGISYLTVRDNPGDHLDWDWLTSQPLSGKTEFVGHVRLKDPLTLKVDGRKSKAVIIADSNPVSSADS